MDKKRWPVAMTSQYRLRSTLHLYANLSSSEVTSFTKYCLQPTCCCTTEFTGLYCRCLGHISMQPAQSTGTMDKTTHLTSVYAAAAHMLCCIVPCSIVCHVPQSASISLASIQTSALEGMSLNPYHTHRHSEGPAFASVILPGT